MSESIVQHQLDEVRALLQRARELFGDNPVEPRPAALDPAGAEPMLP